MRLYLLKQYIVLCGKVRSAGSRRQYKRISAKQAKYITHGAWLEVKLWVATKSKLFIQGQLAMRFKLYKFYSQIILRVTVKMIIICHFILIYVNVVHNYRTLDLMMQAICSSLTYVSKQTYFSTYFQTYFLCCKLEKLERFKKTMG